MLDSLTVPAQETFPSPSQPVADQSAETLVNTTAFMTDTEEEEGVSESSAIEVTVSDEQAIEMGSSQSVDGEFEAILQEFREGITQQLDDEDYETHYDLGIAYKEMGLFDEAIEEFQKAACGTARFVDACTMIAACYKARTLTKSAIACLEHALEDPRCVEAVAPYVQYDLALLYEEENMGDKAIRLYARIPTIRDASERLMRLQSGAGLPH
jgi:tetratricopeptide (TPR) repeat protein